MKGTSAAVVGPKPYSWVVPKIPGISSLQCFEFIKPGVILARKSHNVGEGVTLKSAKYQHSAIPTGDMVAVHHAAFSSTEGARDNLFEPNPNRERDSQVLTRDDTSFQMWMRVRFQQLRAPW